MPWRPNRNRQPSAQVRQRLEVGHWEIDTMVGMRGGYKARLLVCVERSSRYTRLVLLDDGLPETAAAAVHQHLLGDARWPVRSYRLTLRGATRLCSASIMAMILSTVSSSARSWLMTQ